MSRLDSFRAQQGQAVGAQQEQQPPADPYAPQLTPRRRLDSFRAQQGQPVTATPMHGLASPPSVPGLVCRTGLEPRSSRQALLCHSHVRASPWTGAWADVRRGSARWGWLPQHGPRRAPLDAAPQEGGATCRLEQRAVQQQLGGARDAHSNRNLTLTLSLTLTRSLRLTLS